MLESKSDNKYSVSFFSNMIGGTISNLELNEDYLHFEFTDGAILNIYDDRQMCCEKRYMTTNDDLLYYIGSILIDTEVVKAPYIEDDPDTVHEVAFLKVKTTNGVFTIETHNEHNGYYGGFDILCKGMKGE